MPLRSQKLQQGEASKGDLITLDLLCTNSSEVLMKDKFPQNGKYYCLGSL
jgi:hypothetical protein